MGDPVVFPFTFVVLFGATVRHGAPRRATVRHGSECNLLHKKHNHIEWVCVFDHREKRQEAGRVERGIRRCATAPNVIFQMWIVFYEFFWFLFWIFFVLFFCPDFLLVFLFPPFLWNMSGGIFAPPLCMYVFIKSAVSLCPLLLAQ